MIENILLGTEFRRRCWRQSNIHCVFGCLPSQRGSVEGLDSQEPAFESIQNVWLNV
jgi:hypothetical protein